MLILSLQFTLTLVVLFIQLIIYQQLERGLHDSICLHRPVIQLKQERDVLLIVTALLAPWIQFQVPAKKQMER